MSLTIARPAPDEDAEFHKGYIAAVAHDDDGLAVLTRQLQTIHKLRALTPEETARRDAAGKWNGKEMIGHLSDGERVLSYRLLRIARGDETPLPGFDENAYVASANADARELNDLVDELAAVRTATIALVKSLDAAALAYRGVVKNWTLSAR